jgi:hypothetical protein
MPSPFPGMDPWLERQGMFPSLHKTFIAYFLEAVNAVLPPPYFAAIGTRVLIEGETDRLVEPDVDILRPVGGNGSRGPAGGGGIATAEGIEVKPVVVHVSPDAMTEWLVEVRTGDGYDELVTTVELLSRTNKRAGGEDRAAYLRKQREMVERRVNMVEIDLLRAGVQTTAVPLGPAIAKCGRFDYHVSVYRADRPTDFEVYPIRLPQRLPPVQVPLRPGTADVVVGLQTVLDRSYEVGLFARRVRYGRPPDPPLTPEQQTWAEGILKAKGLLPTSDGGAT